MECFREYRVIDAMELRVVNQTKDSGGSTTVATNALAPAASVLGAACQEFRIPMDSRLGIYTKDNVMLTDRKRIASYGLQTGDIVYLRPKVEGDDVLFLVNWRSLAILFLLLAFVGLFLVIAIYAVTAGRAPFVYGVVIDAGSSHSEATLYHWDGSKFHGTGKAEQVGREEIDSYGISELQPREVQRVLEELLEKVKKRIPPSEVSRTKVYLAATAGMRVLNISDPVRVDLNLLAAETAIKGSGMSFGAAGIMSGRDEGLSAWLSVNYLRNRLPRDESAPQNLIGAMDCGGASTQIAFDVPRSENHAEFRLMKLYNHEYNVFSREYLCFGVNEAYNRHIMLLLSEQGYDLNLSIESPCHNKGYNAELGLKKILTPCTAHRDLPQSVISRANDTELRIIGTGEGTVCKVTVANLFPEKDCNTRGFSECFRKLQVKIPDVEFSALSAFAYATEELRFRGTTMRELGSSIDDLCREDYQTLKPRVYDGKEKYAAVGCFKAAYTYNLLQNYGINDANFAKVNFQRVGRRQNPGWSLGYMINATKAIPEADPYAALIPTPWFVVLVIFFSSLLGVGFFAYIISRRRTQRLAHANSEKEEKEELTLKETAA